LADGGQLPGAIIFLRVSSRWLRSLYGQMCTNLFRPPNSEYQTAPTGVTLTRSSMAFSQHFMITGSSPAS
jgi:hypothetical protein